MLFSELYKTMLNKVNLGDFRGEITLITLAGFAPVESLLSLARLMQSFLTSLVLTIL